MAKAKKETYKHLWKNYFLDKDTRNFILIQMKISNKTSKETYNEIGFYSNFKHLIKGLKKHYAFDNIFSVKFEELLSDLQKINEVIEE